MPIEILDSWNEFDTNFALVKTSGGIFTIYRRQVRYNIEGNTEQFVVQPCRISQKFVCISWPDGENPMVLSKSSERFRDDLLKIKDLTGVDPFELMELVEKEEA